MKVSMSSEANNNNFMTDTAPFDEKDEPLSIRINTNVRIRELPEYAYPDFQEQSWTNVALARHSCVRRNSVEALRASFVQSENAGTEVQRRSLRKILKRLKRFWRKF